MGRPPRAAAHVQAQAPDGVSASGRPLPQCRPAYGQRASWQSGRPRRVGFQHHSSHQGLQVTTRLFAENIVQRRRAVTLAGNSSPTPLVSPAASCSSSTGCSTNEDRLFPGAGNSALDNSALPTQPGILPEGQLEIINRRYRLRRLDGRRRRDLEVRLAQRKRLPLPRSLR